MALETVEAGNRVGRGTGLGVEKACVVAAFDPEYILSLHEQQAKKIVTRYGLTAERARVVAELAFSVRGRR